MSFWHWKLKLVSVEFVAKSRRIVGCWLFSGVVFLCTCLFVHFQVCLYERALHQQQPTPASAQHRQHLICKGEKERVPWNSAWILFFVFSWWYFQLKTDYFQAIPTFERQTKYGRGTHAHKRECQDRSWDHIGNALWISTSICFAATLSPLLFHKYPLGTKLYVCFSLQSNASYRQVLLMIFRLSVFSPPRLVRSLSPTVTPFNGALLSLHLYLPRHLPLPSAHHYHLLPFIIFCYIHSQVCLLECPCSHPTSLLPCLYLFLILFYRFLSSPHLISYTLRLDQSALLQSSCPDLLSPLLHGDLVSLFHLDAAPFLSPPSCFSLPLSLSFLACAIGFLSLCAVSFPANISIMFWNKSLCLTQCVCVFFSLITYLKGRCRCGVLYCSEMWV